MRLASVYAKTQDPEISVSLCHGGNTLVAALSRVFYTECCAEGDWVSDTRTKRHLLVKYIEVSGNFGLRPCSWNIRAQLRCRGY